jgi:putative ATP-dependent endonuclease of OLD family
MHLLEQITIKNFRSIKEESFTLGTYTALIGYNNAGKTNILSACNWLLLSSSLGENDFLDPRQPVEITGIISGISEELLTKIAANHKESIKPFVKNEKIEIRRIQNKPKDSTNNIKLYIRKIEDTQAEDSWKANPTGINNAIKAIFPDPILIGAIENIEEDVSKSKQGTTIGKLIAEIITPIEEKYGENAKQALTFLKQTLDSEGEKRADELNEFDKQTNEKLQVLFPSVSIRLHVPTPELKDIFKSGTIKVYEDGQTAGRDISSFGSGAQRSIQMALIRQLADVKKGTNLSPSCTLLLIDEPELYLHPQAIEQVRVALKQLSNEGYQIIFATHSAQMITSEDVRTALLIRKNSNKGTHRRKRIEDAIKEILDGNHEAQLDIMFSLSNANQILFSESVLLIEGKTENKVLPKVFEIITNGETFGTNKCALVKLDGSGNTWKSMKILSALDIPVKAIVDLDYAFSQGIDDGNIANDDPDKIACLNIFSSMMNNGEVELNERGIPKKQNISGKKKNYEAFFEMANSEKGKYHIQNLHTKLKEKGIWLWKKGAIEAHLGLPEKTVRVWAKFVREISEADDISEIIPDFEEVKNLITWIKN